MTLRLISDISFLIESRACMVSNFDLTWFLIPVLFSEPLLEYVFDIVSVLVYKKELLLLEDYLADESYD